MEDAENLARNANNPRVARFMTNGFPHPYTLSHAQSFIEMASASNPLQIFAIEVGGVASGGIGIHPQKDIQCKNAEIGYWLAETHWGKGIVSRALKELIPYAFANFDITRLFARPFGSNVPSQKLLEKNGFVLEARFKDSFFKNGEFEDELIYALRK